MTLHITPNWCVDLSQDPEAMLLCMFAINTCKLLHRWDLLGLVSVLLILSSFNTLHCTCHAKPSDSNDACFMHRHDLLILNPVYGGRPTNIKIWNTHLQSVQFYWLRIKCYDMYMGSIETYLVLSLFLFLTNIWVFLRWIFSKCFIYYWWFSILWWRHFFHFLLSFWFWTWKPKQGRNIDCLLKLDFKQTQ